MILILLRVVAFGLCSQGYFGEEGSAKQSEKSWFNLAEGRFPETRLGKVSPGFARAFIPIIRRIFWYYLL
jgi:hypothetical protein